MTPLFLHVKGGNDGFPERLFDAIRIKGWLDCAYVFCSPSNDAMLARMKQASATIRTLATVEDRDGLPLVLFRDEWALQHAEEKHPELKFLSAAPQPKGTRFVSVPA